jgi:cell wall assembly regulator SMI1
MPALHDFATWAPILHRIREERPDLHEWMGGVGVGAFSLPPPVGEPGEYYVSLLDAARPLQAALREAGKDSIEFAVLISTDGRAVVTASADSASARIVRDLGMNTAGHVILVDGAVPEPARREPETFHGLGPAPSADPELLERILRERVPDAVGATDAELTEVEQRLGISLPAELAAMLRVTRTCRDERDIDALGRIELFALDAIERASEADVRKGLPIDMLAKVAAVTGPDSAVQGLVTSRGWIVIGDHGGGTGDWAAVDLSPGPAGYIGQVVVLSHESEIGAWLLADSLTDLVLGHERAAESSDPGREPPAVVMVNSSEGWTVQAAATDQLEVLTIGFWDDAPSDLRPLVGLPRLRTLDAMPGKVADPLVIGRLTRLEYLELGLADWRALLDAGAVPRSLLAAGISGYNLNPTEVDEVYDALIRLWGGTGLRTVTIEGVLG